MKLVGPCSAEIQPEVWKVADNWQLTLSISSYSNNMDTCRCVSCNYKCIVFCFSINRHSLIWHDHIPMVQTAAPKKKAIVTRPSFVERSWLSGYMRLENGMGCWADPYSLKGGSGLATHDYITTASPPVSCSQTASSISTYWRHQ